MSRSAWGWHPNKYIWNNNGTWWMRVQPTHEIYKQPRMAFSLKTHDLEEARRKRDEMLAVNRWPLAKR